MINPLFGDYRVTAKLGQGGMGEVYRATDTKLDREVAIKVLPESVAQDKERLARFEREAKALAALNHPNIAGIYGLEKTGNSQALILELVEGEDLSDRLTRGPLSVEEALDVCKQIAEALEAAHEKGIVHRDLKPGNVKLTADGKVKVLDFGLAKVGLAVPSEPSCGAEGTPRPTVVDPDSPTITADYTMPGTLLGTAGYMSPEQARGKPVDKRSDIWMLPVELTASGDLQAGKPTPVATAAFAESAGQVSPDGNWIAYTSDEVKTGQQDVFVQPFPPKPGGGKWRISVGDYDSVQPRWSPDGGEIYYFNGPPVRRTLMSVKIARAAPESQEAQAIFEVSSPKRLFEISINSYHPATGSFFYSVARDGERFLINFVDVTEEPVLKVNVNWEQLKWPEP